MESELLDLVGKQVGHYFLSSLLGCGAAGSVYKAVDTTLESLPTLAIKCVRESNSARRRRQQLAEIDNHDAVARCPHVMKLYDFFYEDDYLFLVFPLCEMDMFRAIWKEKMYWKNDALIKEAFVKILDGVLSCHIKGVYHRDLKPENIMCDASGKEIRIGDFGLSSDTPICTDGGCGTSYYMSPECLDKDVRCYYAEPADVWSLGVILFNMVTCRYPWEEAGPKDKAYFAFLTKKDYLLHKSPISESLCMLLNHIWNPIPLNRLSIPAIRKAILGMDTFYKPGPSRSTRTSPLVKEIALPVVDSQQTCVAPAEDEKKKDSAQQGQHPKDTLDEIPLSRLELNSENIRLYLGYALSD